MTAEEKPELAKKIEMLQQASSRINSLRELAKLMCPGAKIELISCSTIKDDEKGEEFAKNMEAIFGTGNVQGYGCVTKWGLFGSVWEVKQIKGTRIIKCKTRTDGPQYPQ